MAIHWQTGKEETDSRVLFRLEQGGSWKEQKGTFTQLSDTDYLAHLVKLEDLEPNCQYEFKIEGKEGSYRFQTMPGSLKRRVRFVVGGDAYSHLGLLRQMNALIASQNPDFVVVGGDIAYAYGHSLLRRTKQGSIKRWREFLREWKTQMVTSQGMMIPMLAVVGNHDVRRKNKDGVFETLFAFSDSDTSYRAVDFGNYLSLVLLDTGHIHPIDGDQVEWLRQTLKAREHVPYMMAAYHMGGYPSVYSYEGSTPSRIRKCWSPLFEQYHLNLAFEHHNHAYKRTYPIKNNQIDAEGVVYLGDGSWGVSPRYVKNSKMWYLEKAKKINAVCLITLDEKEGQMEALSIEGDRIDLMQIDARGV